MKNVFSILICIVIVTIMPRNAKAQDLHEAPSLQIGLSGINFTKGNLDPELIAEIIAEKQKEVKVKLIKNMLLKNLGVDNGLFYAFIDHNIDILTTEKDENTRVKNLLENAGVSIKLCQCVNLLYLFCQEKRRKALLGSNQSRDNLTR